MSNQNSFSTEERILKFLRDYPYDPIKIVVGFASTWGLAWLHRNIKNRRVDLLIGYPEKFQIWDLQHANVDAPPELVSKQALEFLRRGEVSVYIWAKETSKPSKVDTKAWMVERQNRTAILVGSANLSQNGFQNNQELMVEPSIFDGDYAIEEVKKLFVESVDRTSGLIRKILNHSKTMASSQQSNQQSGNEPSSRQQISVRRPRPISSHVHRN